MPQSLSESYFFYFFRHQIALDASKYFEVLQKCSNVLNTIVPHVFYLNVTTKSITNYNFDESEDRKKYHLRAISANGLNKM